MITPQQLIEAISLQDDKRHGIEQAYFSRTPDDSEMRDFLFDGRMDLFAVCDELNAILKR